MNEQTLRSILENLKAGKTSVDEAQNELRKWPFEPMGFANVDHHRSLRCGFPEVIYCPGKTPDHVGEIFSRLAAAGGNVLATRADDDDYAAVVARCPEAQHHSMARAITLTRPDAPEPVGHVAVVSAGTSDLPVAMEAKVTAEIVGAKVTTHFDVGVAGIHRLLAASEVLQQAKVVVVTAGMEGALASVVGGLVGVPVIAVPTSIGYGASFHGLAALLSMLNSCASNVSVVNIDNGFAGGYIGAMINRQSVSGT